MSRVASADSAGPLAEAIAWSLNRRSFLAAGSSLAVASTLPLPLPPKAQGMTANEWLSDWTIDDMWGGLATSGRSDRLRSPIHRFRAGA